MADWDNRLEFESYLCNYFIRRNMYATAELYRNEVNLPLDRMTPIINPQEGMLTKWWRTSYEEVDFFKEMMHKSHTRGKALSVMDKQRREGMKEKNAPQSGMRPMNVQANKQLLNKFSSSMSRGSKAMQSTGLHGSNHVPQGYKLEPLTPKQRKCTPISYAKIVQQLEPVFCALEKKGKAAYEDEEMDPEIRHLIDTFWELDNCPPSLLGGITLEVKGIAKTRTSPKKLRRVYTTADLF